jgi:hypothetical protein
MAIQAKKHLVPIERTKLIALSKEVNPKISLELLNVFKPLFVPNKRPRLIKGIKLKE